MFLKTKCMHLFPNNYQHQDPDTNPLLHRVVVVFLDDEKAKDEMINGME